MEKGVSNQNVRSAIFVPIYVILAIFTVRHFNNYIQSNVIDSQLEIHNDFALNVQTEEDVDLLFSWNLPMVLVFGAAWCSPCKLMEPTLEKLNEEFRGVAIIKYIDVDDFREFSSDYPITAVPTLFFYNPDMTPYVPDEDLAIELILYKHTETEKHSFTAHEGFLDEQEILLILEKMGVEINTSRLGEHIDGE